MGRRCLITGASGGIGGAVARRFAAVGFEVVACGRSGERLGELQRSLGRSGGVSIEVFDVRCAQQVRGAFERVGSVDVVVAAAGVCRQSRFDEPDGDEIWRDVMRTNLDGVFHCLRAASATLTAGGSFVAVSSGLGRRGRAGYGAYCAAKHGVLGLVRCAALEFAESGRRVNAVCPGWVDTAMARADLAASAERAGVGVDVLRARALAGIPLGRMVSVPEVAELIWWLSSDGAAAITGQAYNICGGELGD